MAATASDGPQLKRLTESLKRFSRSIELCDDYLRGYYGLKLVTDKLLRDDSKSAKQPDADDWSPPDEATVQKLKELATKKLSEIVRRKDAGEKSWQGYSESEVAAARDLLSKESADVVR
ncbi:hypothetical protein BN1708_017358 [Verticillium longisporum]|uniref:Uncharacterized protein n=1 Tax=Verticillium longisporum TaxID=100787 RepID=A0A0G4KZI7_VERLO|nr:hypothetical protein BN1708_017358 [Verticillium longisporum]